MTKSKRMIIHLADDLDVWIGEQAAREGLDSPTWARVVLTRLKNGLPAVPGSAPQLMAPELPPVPLPMAVEHNSPSQESPERFDLLDDLLESRVEQAAQAAATASFVTSPPAANDLSHELVGAAHPLRRLERVKYNPGRGGYG